VDSCSISEVGDSGIQLRGGDRLTLEPCANFATNNHIWRFSRWSRTYSPGVNLDGVGMRLAHNHIHDAPHSAVIYWGNEHLIEYNDIHHVCLETGDAGAIYTGRDYTTRGNVIQYNFVHEIGGEGPVLIGTMGMYFDDCVSGQTLFGNIFRRAPRAAFVGGGRDIVIENNIFIDCFPAVEVDGRGLSPAAVWQNMVHQTMKERLDAVNHHQPPYSLRYPELKELDIYYEKGGGIPPGNIRIHRNIFVGGEWLHVHWFAEEQHLSLGQNLVGQDPGFADFEQGDYHLQPNSPAWTIGFEQLPLKQIGIQTGTEHP